MSRTVQEVERRVGAQLFQRTTRYVELTREGAAFLAIARRVTADFDAAMNHFSGYLTGLRGNITIATLASVAATVLPPILMRFREMWPNVTVSVQDAFAREVSSKVSAGEVDLAISTMDDKGPDLEAHRLLTDRLTCIFSESHRFNDLDAIAWRDLNGEPFIAFDPASSVRIAVDKALSSEQIALGRILEARDIGAVAGLTAAGLGVSVVPTLVLPMVTFAGIRSRRLHQPVVERELYLILDTRRPVSPAANNLISILREHTGGARLGEGAHWIDVDP